MSPARFTPRKGRWLGPDILKGPALTAAVADIAADVADRARANAPVDAGDLRASIGHETRISGDRVIGVAYATDPAAPYVEWGTKHTPATHFMKRAAQ